MWPLADIPTFLDAATAPANMNAPGYALHSLKGDLEGHWAVRVHSLTGDRKGTWSLSVTVTAV
jgi:hypothetical protein